MLLTFSIRCISKLIMVFLAFALLKYSSKSMIIVVLLKKEISEIRKI
jgi:uncharacterized protein (DUF486 family)